MLSKKPFGEASINQKNLDRFQSQNLSRDYRVRAILELVPQVSGKILDLGSGGGEMVIFFSRYAEVVYAVEKSQDLFEKLKKRAKSIPNLVVKKIDVEKLRLKERNFDLVTACDIAEHLKDDSRFFEKCYCHLVKGGMLFVSVPAVKFLYGIRDRKYCHYRRYSKKEIVKKIRKAGFSILRCQYWNFLGFLPYFFSEKIFKKELTAPARKISDSFLLRPLNKLLYFLLFLETKIKFLPIGLSLIVLAQKNES